MMLEGFCHGEGLEMEGMQSGSEGIFMRWSRSQPSWGA